MRKLNKKRLFRSMFSMAFIVIVFICALQFFQRYLLAQTMDISTQTHLEQNFANQTTHQTTTPKQIDKSEIILVNYDNPIPGSYQPDLVETESGYLIDRQAALPLETMLWDARNEGLNLTINSAYRSNATQKKLFYNKVRSLKKLGYSEKNAYEEAKSTVALPGYSEHHLGLAVDIESGTPADLESEFENTLEGIWLKNNCYKYGFILRYPPEKTHLTQIIYEPWHFRYVGVDIATEIMESGLCLEEYLHR